MKRTRSIYLVISVMMLSAAVPAFARMRPRYGSVLRIETRESVADPSTLAGLIGDTLTRVDDAGRVQPWLADRWESQNGDRRWVMTLHPRVVMHDGTPLTSSVIAEMLSSVSNAPWKSVRGSDATVTFESDTPMPNLAAQLASPAFSIVRRIADGTLVGSGPFRVASVTGANATLEANDSYWRGRPYLDRVELHGSRNLKSQWLDLGVNGADVVEVPGEFIRRARNERLKVLASDAEDLVTLQVSPNIDAEVRRALSQSIDRASLAGVVFQRQGEPSLTLLPNHMTGYARLFTAGYDVAAARAVAARLPRNLVLRLAYDAADPSMQLAAERIALNARDAGLNLVAQPRNSAVPAQISLLRVKLPSSNPAACLAELSRELLGQPRAISPDLQSVYEAERELLSSATLIPVAHLPRTMAVVENVRDLEIDWGGAQIANSWIEERR